MNGILKLTKKMEKELLKKPNHIQKIRKTFDKKSKSVLKTIKALKEKDFSRVSNKKLLDLYKKILRDYHEVYHYGEPIAFAARNFAERTQPKFKGTDDEFNHVITPVEKSFLQKERLSLLRIFLSKKEVNNKLRLHTKKFEWVPYDYGVTYFTKEDFKKEFEKLKKKPIKDIKQKYNFLFNYSTIIKKKHESIIKKYEVDKHLKALFEVIQNSTYLLDYKKEIFTKLHWYSVRLFSEIEKRFSYTKKQVQYMLPEEVVNLISGKAKPNKKRLDERNKGVICHITVSGKCILTEGKEAQKIISSFEKEKTKTKSKVIKGRTVSKGFAKGQARILKDAKNCNKMKHGEILIATMTSPDYIIAIRKAAAIVTDEGGITCHAAIVARELKIPCIVGTKVATKIFKDGDLVEVDANKGIVKKCSKKTKRKKKLFEFRTIKNCSKKNKKEKKTF
ncbi:MAG: hypothetical protein KKF89_05845 [Nanoarchaeota archaeon]|nr:hypothetical protein [Nanoarchaeota archaeon]